MKVVAGGGEWNPAVARVGRYSCAPIKVESIDANHLGWAELEIKDICVSYALVPRVGVHGVMQHADN